MTRGGQGDIRFYAIPTGTSSAPAVASSGGMVELGGTNDNSATNLEACIGECDNDGQCRAGLKCFQRKGFTPVPGCAGKGKKDWDYCYDPTWVAGAASPGEPILIFSKGSFGNHPTDAATFNSMAQSSGLIR